ncbi:MAG: ABC transporter permease [Phycisphaerae bacterium]|nr:ABC transporter permease [Phycisphaerae bacterium]
MTLLPFDYAVRNLGRSRARLLLSLLGSALVVLLVLAAAAFVRGMTLSLRSSGEPNNVIILGTGSEDSIERSEIEASVASVLNASIPGIRSQNGVPFASPEVHVQLPVRVGEEQSKGTIILVRGVTLAAMLVHPSVQIIEGRFPRSGHDEILVGSSAAIKLGVRPEELAPGRTLRIDARQWTIVGRFVAPGTVYEAEIWAPLVDIKEATKRLTDSCVIVTLDPDISELADVSVFTRTRVDLELSAMGETDYYARLADFFAPIRAVTWITAGLIALGGLFGGLNTMYAAFASRVREIGTLQALGFQRAAIVVSLVQESVLATTAGSLLAASIGLLLFDGVAVRFSLGVFGLIIDAQVLGIALLSGVILGFVGALPPAIRCLKLPIPIALRAV